MSLGCRTDYDHDRAAELFGASGIPEVERDVQTLLDPPGRAEVVDHAESVVFAG